MKKANVQSTIKKRVLQEPNKYILDFKKGEKENLFELLL